MRRLQVVHATHQKQGGFPERVAGYLGRKYGYTPEVGASAGARVRELLGLFARELRTQRAAGGSYYLGDRLSALDVYSATFMGLLSPLPEPQCRMNPAIRAAFETLDEETRRGARPGATRTPRHDVRQAPGVAAVVVAGGKLSAGGRHV